MPHPVIPISLLQYSDYSPAAGIKEIPDIAYDASGLLARPRCGGASRQSAR
jgi:hypothetical protein